MRGKSKGMACCTQGLPLLITSFLKGILHLIRELVNRFNAGWRLMQFEAHPGMSAGIEKEGCLLHGGADMVVVGELCQGEECVPIILSFSNKDPQILFQFLVNLFHLSVCLQVVGSRCCGFHSQQLVQLLHEGGNELQPTVRHNLPWKAMELPDVLKVEVCCSGDSDCGDHFDEVGAFAYGVDGYHDGVVSA